MEMLDFYVSTAYIIMTLVISDFARYILQRDFLNPNSLLQRCGQEFICAFELSAVCYENGLILSKYGTGVYALYLFLLTLWWGYSWNAYANPSFHVENWLNGQVDAISGLALIVSEIIGASIFYRYYLKYLWSLGYGDTHIELVRQQECSSDIQVAALKGALIEGTAVFICRFTGRMMSQMNNKVSAVLDAAIGTGLVVAALSTTGGYLNPVLASALQYGCAGATVGQHLTVYWIGGIVGSVLAYLVWQIDVVRDTFTVKAKLE